MINLTWSEVTIPQQSLDSSPVKAIVSGSFKMSCAKKSTLAKTIQSFILKKNLLIWRGLIILCPVVAKSVEIQILITKQRTRSYVDVLRSKGW